MEFEVLVETSLRPGIADPEGSTIERALGSLGYDGCSQVRVGKAVRMRVEAPDAAAAEARVRDICDHFLTNPVIEEAAISVTEPAGAGS